MSRDKISEYSHIANENSDVGGIGIKGSDPVHNMDNALRKIMAHLADLNAGISAIEDTFKIADSHDARKTVRFDLGDVGVDTDRVLKIPDENGTILTDENTDLDAARLSGQTGVFYQNASNLVSGEVSHERLPAEISSNTTGNAATATHAITADSATSAANATHAITADNATNSTTATTATHATTADSATNSTTAATASNATTHIARTDNPHNITKAQIGLANVDDTSDADKPVSTLMQAELDQKLALSGGQLQGDIDLNGHSLIGYTGPAGADGAQGQQGDPGPQGDPGAQGPAGDTSTLMSLNRAGIAWNGVGQHIFAKCSGNDWIVTPGETRAGSSLGATNATGYGGQTLSGTWRALGRAGQFYSNSYGNAGLVTLWERVL